MTRILLSIKPKFVEKIFDGTKRFEFRRVIFKNKDVNKVVIYSSSPVQKVVGEFEISEIINENIENLWDRTGELSGISEAYYYEYFNDKKEGYALGIKNVVKYKVPLDLKETFDVHAPQSFVYIK